MLNSTLHYKLKNVEGMWVEKFNPLLHHRQNKGVNICSHITTKVHDIINNILGYEYQRTAKSCALEIKINVTLEVIDTTTDHSWEDHNKKMVQDWIPKTEYRKKLFGMEKWPTSLKWNIMFLLLNLKKILIHESVKFLST